MGKWSLWQEQTGTDDIRVEMRMRNDDHLDASELLYLLDCVFIDIRNQVPEHVTMRCTYQSRTLTDSKLLRLATPA
jgi:hypothetical protein